MTIIIILLVVIASLLCIAVGFICWSIFFLLSKVFQLMAALDAKHSIHVGDIQEGQRYNQAVLDIMKKKKTGDTVAQRSTSITSVKRGDEQLTRLEDMSFDDAYEALEKVANDGITR